MLRNFAKVKNQVSNKLVFDNINRQYKALILKDYVLLWEEENLWI